jgi:hypothetical protein
VLLRAGELTGGTAFSPRIRIYDPNGALVDSDAQVGGYNNSEAAVDVTTESSGTYTVVIDSYYLNGTGNYQLQILRVPGAFTIPQGDEGGGLTKDGTDSGSITIGDLDVWTFEANQGDVITLSMKELTGGFSPYLLVYGPTGELLAYQNHASQAQVSFTAPDSGLFVVVATSGTLGGTGTYQLTNGGLPVQGIPLRVARLAQGFLTVNWPSALAGYVLQESPTLDPANWQDITVPVGDNGLNARISAPTEGNLFFRLRPPP